MSFNNPINAPDVVIPVVVPNSEQQSYLVVRRNQMPCRGEISFPGGYQNEGDSLRVAAVREVQEEVGITINPMDLKFIDEKINDRNRNLSFWLAPAMNYADLFDQDGKYKFPIQEEEVQEVLIGTVNDTLCFPFHDQVLKDLHSPIVQQNYA